MPQSPRPAHAAKQSLHSSSPSRPHSAFSRPLILSPRLLFLQKPPAPPGGVSRPAPPPPPPTHKVSSYLYIPPFPVRAAPHYTHTPTHTPYTTSMLPPTIPKTLLPPTTSVRLRRRRLPRRRRGFTGGRGRKGRCGPPGRRRWRVRRRR